jgi:hypothetical protein
MLYNYHNSDSRDSLAGGEISIGDEISIEGGISIPSIGRGAIWGGLEFQIA